MAQGEMDDFLKKYYRRLHVSAMDDEVLARLVDNYKKGLLTNEQESWFKDGFIVPDPNAPLGYKAADLPELNNTTDITEDELKKLYQRCAAAMAGMKTDSITYSAKDEEVKNFVKYFVDEAQLFPTPKATQDCENSINKLLNLLDETGKTPEEQETIKNIKQIILNETKKFDDSTKNLFNSAEDIEKLFKKCKDGKYNSDTSVQTKIQQVALTLDNYLNSWSYDGANNTKQKNKEFLGPLSDGLSIISRNDAFSVIDITNDKLDDFKNIYGQEILYTLYHNKDIREKFGKHDYNFVEYITKAEGKISYQDPNSDDYVTPKADDALDPVQQIEKWATDSYNNTIRKYARLRGDPLLFSTFSKEISKALDKEEIKPTDGVSGIIDKAEAIKKRLPNKTISDHFDWFVKTMSEINKKYPKAVEGSWKNAKQMKVVVEQIILKATGPNARDGDFEKAKTAMEIMTAMKYGMMTSKVMDAMRQTDFNIFSDSNLSWNKDEGIQFVTKALDTSVKAAFLGIGYSISFVRNAIMLSGRKFKNEDNKQGSLAARYKSEQDRLTRKQIADNKTKQMLDTRDAATITDRRNQLRALDTNDGINASTRARKKQEVASRESTMKANEQTMNGFKAQMDGLKQKHDEYEQNKQVYDEYNNLGGEITRLQRELAQKKNEIITLRNKIINNYIDPVTGLPMGDVERKEYETQLTEQLKPLQSDYDQINDQLTECQNKQTPVYYNNTVVPAMHNMNRLDADNNAYVQAEKDYNNAKNQYESSKNSYNDLNNKVQLFTDATKEIEELTKAIDDRRTAMQQWPQENVNKVRDLENFWNFLQTGKTKTLRLNTANAQTRFDNNKQQWLQDYVSQHGLR